MPKPRPPFLQREKTRHGKTVWYFRRGDGPRIRIFAEYGTPEFSAGYEAAYSGQRLEPKTTSPESLEWLIDQYKRSSSWESLSPATRDQRDNIYKNVVKSVGAAPFAAIDRGKIAEGRDRRRLTPNQANNFIKSMRGLFAWAVERGIAPSNPTEGVKLVTIKTSGFHVWSDEEVERYEAKFPRGTRERVWLDVLLYTGLRRGDASRLGPGHVRDGVFKIATEKTGIEVSATIIAPLAETLAVGPIGTETFICGARGEPLTKESFGNYFRRACKAAGVPGAAHGLRKAAATRAGENGVTHLQLQALFGWRGNKLPALYTQTADRARLAADAVKSLSKVRGTPRKPK